ncbi:HpcH/HpaI aldolase family protein [Bailinhaonella thermotolerans]|uniref:2-dehydro-3-deoxyglucarate aldolase n=1 Tax=Bailinhaonella thermotolerans TaxID=1070861 RepID=A0A3A4A059_9ACTN|nr:aldolase/citrate lyase family protein [Bailinhaonella thermotolerans]RJL21108.1 2-dehydro-3-deoxyglucarate aldolase [Bailinhaonella thermotolerans]
MPTLKERLGDDGPPLIGTLLTLDSPESAAVLRVAGLSWYFLDQEHSPLLTSSAVQRLLEVLQPQAHAVVRVPSNDPVLIARALDAGADGVIVPHVTSGRDAAAAVAAASYPPEGRRSVGIARAHGYGADLAPYLKGANAGVSVIAQVEDAAAVAQIDQIVATPGLAAVYIGPYDLSGSLGVLGQLGHPAVVEAIARVRGACARATMPLGIFCATPAAARAEVAAGTRLITVGSDVGLLREGASALRAAVMGGS